MKVAIDLDGTISADPEFYKAELGGLVSHGHDVTVLSGNPHAQHVLAQHGFVQGRDFHCVGIVPLKHIAAAKVAYMHAARITHLIDNSKKNCRAARHAGITAHHHMKPKGATA